MKNNIQEIKDLSIGFTSQKGEQISILRNITTNIKKFNAFSFICI